MKVVLGDMFGKHAKDESPTKPRVTLVSAVVSTANPNLGATTIMHENWERPWAL